MVWCFESPGHKSQALVLKWEPPSEIKLSGGLKVLHESQIAVAEFSALVSPNRTAVGLEIVLERVQVFRPRVTLCHL